MDTTTQRRPAWNGAGRGATALTLAVAGAITFAIVGAVGAGFSSPTGYALARALQPSPAAYAAGRAPIEVAIVPAVIDVIGVRERASTDSPDRGPV